MRASSRFMMIWGGAVMLAGCAGSPYNPYRSEPTDRAPVYERTSPVPQATPRSEALPDRGYEEPEQGSSYQEQEAYQPPPRGVVSSPAVVALMGEAEHERRGGNLDGAAATLERALRIQPRNASLWHRLAQVRLQQEQPQLAEDLAKKSNSLAGGDPVLMAQNWRLIAESRRRQGDYEGADFAERKARSF